MNILLIAPHPFYQDRGTPIAVDMLLRVLSAEGHRVDVCTFPEGEARQYPGVAIHRAAPWGRVTGVAPGFSLKKLYTDVFLFALATRLCRQNDYDVVHAIEEAGFLGLYLKARRGVPYVYDMDSVLSDQLVESRPWLAPLRRVFESLENRVVAGACVLAPMCQALVDRMKAFQRSGVVVLKDVSLIEDEGVPSEEPEDLRSEFGIDGPLAMYIGNLEAYQGIDLMLDAFARALEYVDATLVIIGGKPADIRKYREQARGLGIAGRVRLIGPRPVSRLAEYLRQADVLVSPRTRGNNTPMKIYSYLHSGVALLATDLPTHTQVLNEDIAELAAPDPASFGRSLASLLENEAKREEQSRRAAEYARREHSIESFRRSVQTLYREVAESCQPSRT
ncbi:MAG: glycosyltransferase family 4 protein [Gammaproteobacteria bacterium]|nr:glycosyltransferase family 4 protein [Gammaproteobacteria bacterium]